MKVGAARKLADVGNLLAANGMLDVAWRLLHPIVQVRVRAARELGKHPLGHSELDALALALDDDELSVREAVVEALDRMVAARPRTFAELLELANDEQTPGGVGLARYLVHVGTPETIETALPIIAGDTFGEERRELLHALSEANGLTDERLRTILADGAREDEPLHATAAEILGLRGFAEGYQELLRAHGSRSLYEDMIARGPEGVRILCCAFPLHDETYGDIAERLAARRKKTEPTVLELIDAPSSPGARTAVQVLGYWDEPHIVELLIQIAQDPARDCCVREEAIVSLGRLEAPEAMELLIRTLLDTQQKNWLRWHCASALGDIGKPDALEALESVLKSDPDETLRRFAQDAIEIIRNPG